MATIASDPRYQRRLQEARARAQYGNPPRTRGITAEFTARNQATTLNFQRLGLQDMRNREVLRQMQNVENQTRRRIRDIEKAKSTFRTGNVMGLGTSLYATYEGKRRQKLINQQAQEQRAFNLGIVDALNRRTI